MDPLDIPPGPRRPANNMTLCCVVLRLTIICHLSTIEKPPMGLSPIQGCALFFSLLSTPTSHVPDIVPIEGCCHRFELPGGLTVPASCFFCICSKAHRYWLNLSILETRVRASAASRLASICSMAAWYCSNATALLAAEAPAGG